LKKKENNYSIMFVVKNPECIHSDYLNILFDDNGAFLFSLDTTTNPVSLELTTQTIQNNQMIELKMDCLGNPVESLLRYNSNVYVFNQLENDLWIYNGSITKSTVLQQSMAFQSNSDRLDSFIVTFGVLMFVSIHIILWYRWVHILNASSD